MRREAVYFSTQGPTGPHRLSNTLYSRIFYRGCYFGELYVFLFCCVTRARLKSHATRVASENSVQLTHSRRNRNGGRMIAIGLLFVRMLCDWFKPRQQLEAEILVLRHQLNVLQQRAPRQFSGFQQKVVGITTAVVPHRVAV